MNMNDFPSSTLFHYPILLVLSDGEEHTQKEFRNKIIEYVGISEKSQKETLKNGTNKVTSWTYFAIRNLKDANLITTKAKGSGKYIITEKGKKLLSIKPNGFRGGHVKTLLSMLKKLGISSDSNYQENAPIKILQKESEEKESITVKLTELAARANDKLADDLLVAVKQMEPKSFEVLIKRLLIAMGYGKSTDDVIVTQYVGDNGIDGYVRKDRLDIEKLCAYQAKRYTNSNVGITEMNALGGSMINCGTECGIFVTTTDFTSSAKNYNPRGYKIIRIDGKSLIGYLIEYGIGIKTEVIEVKTVDIDFLKGLL